MGGQNFSKEVVDSNSSRLKLNNCTVFADQCAVFSIQHTRHFMAYKVPIFSLILPRTNQQIAIRHYIDTVIEYRIMILCSMNIEVSKWLYVVLSDASLM